MKIIKTASGNQIKMSKSEWQRIGERAGWSENTSDQLQILKNIMLTVDKLKLMHEKAKEFSGSGSVIDSENVSSLESTISSIKTDLLGAFDQETISYAQYKKLVDNIVKVEAEFRFLANNEHGGMFADASALTNFEKNIMSLMSLFD
jgi:hypothetical protein